MRQAALLPRITRVVIATAGTCFLLLLLSGPLQESLLDERLFSLTLVLLSTLIVAFATRRIAFALMVACVLFGGVLIASVIKFKYLTTPFLAPDLVYFVNRDLLDVALHYPPILIALIGGVVLIPTLLIVFWRADRPLFLNDFAQPQRAWMQIGGALATVAVLLAIDAPSGPFSEVFEKGMWQTMNDRSYISDFFTSFHQTEVVVPDSTPETGPRLSWLQSAADNPPTCTGAQCAAGSAPKAAQAYPDIVSVLEESTFDPTMLPVCTLPLCRQKMFEPDGRSRSHGFLTVHVWGGGTWTSEFALLSGLDHESFGDAGLYAPYNLAPRVTHSLPDVLHAAGYRVIAIYPMSGNFINARNAYRDYGFDKFYDGQDYGLSWESSDYDLMQVFDRIYDDERKAVGKQPLFVMMLTLHQHGPHMTPLNELAAPYNLPLFPGKFAPKDLDEWLNLNLGNYLSRLIGSDAAITHLERKLLDAERPALLFHFGDHQPSFDGAMRALEKKVPREVADPNFVTYYMLKTNFKPTRSYDYPVLDLSFGGALIMDIAGIKKDEFFQANALMRERCQGLYLTCANKQTLDSYRNYVFHTLGALHD